METFIKAFRPQPDGSWLCIAPAEFNGPNGRIQVTAGRCFQRGDIFMGADLAAWLEERWQESSLAKYDLS
jgi:hypothetical protein